MTRAHRILIMNAGKSEQIGAARGVPEARHHGPPVSVVDKEGRRPLRCAAEHLHLFDPECGQRIEA